MAESKKILQSLQELGLNEKEAQIFLALLKRGLSNASQIAHLLDLPKSSILDQLNELARRGFILRHKKKNAFLFSADLSRLHDAVSKQKETITEREKIVAELLPSLEKLEGFGSKRPQIEYLEGDEALEEAFQDFLRVKPKEILGYGNSEWNLSTKNVFPRFYDRRAKAKIPWRGLIPATKLSLEDTWQSDQKHLRKSIYFPPEFFASPEVNVYGNTVSIVSFKEKFLVRIRSKEIAKAFRNILELSIRGVHDDNARIREEIKKTGLKQYVQEHKTEIEKALKEDE